MIKSFLIISYITSLLLFDAFHRIVIPADKYFVSSNQVKIIPPPKGMYLGQTELINKGDKTMFESAINRKVAIWADIGVMSGQEESDDHSLSFNVKKARQLWNQGYIFYVSAYEPYPGHGTFTVDKLLKGEYDNDLHKLALQFKEFGKPMFFCTAREPNGALSPYMGGYGPDGDKSIGWAENKKKGFDEFHPPPGAPGNPTLYANLGNADTCDGLERLAAAQRYYYDFFVRREKINFLTFETMGWAALLPPIDDPPGSHNFNLYKNCFDFYNFYQGIKDYSDWISINWYMITDMDSDVIASIDPITDLKFIMKKIRKIAPEKPVLLTELGFCGKNHLKRAEYIKIGMIEILKKYPEIKGFIQWVSETESPGYFPFPDCLSRSNTPEGTAFKKIVDDYPDYFHSCAYFSDGSTIPNCRDPYVVKTSKKID